MNDMIKALFAEAPEPATVPAPAPRREKPAREPVPVTPVKPAPDDGQAARTAQWFVDLRQTLLMLRDEVNRSKAKEHKPFIRPQLNAAADAAMTLQRTLLDLSDT